MNRREVRREALWRAAGLLRGELADGWPNPERYPDDATYARVVEELNVLLVELERRGRPAPQLVPSQDLARSHVDVEQG